MKLSSKIYQTLLSIYRILPFRPYWARLIRSLPIDLERVYRDLHFRGVFTVRSKSGKFKIHHLETTIENELFWKGLENSLEDDTIWLWMQLCLKSRIVLDIGANTGVYALIAKTENPNSQVVAFEPSNKIFPKLEANIKLNDIDIRCEQIALSNSNRMQTFYDIDSAEFPSSASLSASKEKYRIPGREDIVEYEVQCFTIDHYLAKNSIENVDLIKIDVELHEPEVFEGFKQLQKFRPAIVVEILTEDVAEKIISIADLTNYRFFKLIGPHHMVELDMLKADPDHRNFLLLPLERSLSSNITIDDTRTQP